MAKQVVSVAARWAGYVILLGSVCMLTGAVLNLTSGADIDLYLYAGDMSGFLAQALAHQTGLIINLSIWIVGVILIGAGATLITAIGGQSPLGALLVRYNYGVGIPLVVVAYMAWLAVVVRVAPAATDQAALLAEGLGWFAVRADWVATVLVLGTGPVLLTTFGRDTWAPYWLHMWSYVALVAGLLNVIAQYAGGLTSYGFLIIPVGMGWMIATGVVLLRRAAAAGRQVG